MIATEKIVCNISLSLVAQSHEGTPGPIRKHREQEENVGQRLYCDLCGKKQVRQDK